MSFLSKLFGGGAANENLKSLLSEGAVLVDVRSSEEFRAGHAQKAINIPLQLISQSTGKLKGKTVVTVCKSGARSSMAVSILQQAGIKAYNGGSWTNFAGKS
ncbi:MAG TPA: rhodanese-like domain-containing protein [Panacibacter sp.]|nr:rhodanese-like domain-containing protein [Panacibacter sp.]HNP44758.1 rhodanese-like domain-containing protein [Panacibacter sp.]